MTSQSQSAQLVFFTVVCMTKGGDFCTPPPFTIKALKALSHSSRGNGHSVTGTLLEAQCLLTFPLYRRGTYLTCALIQLGS